MNKIQRKIFITYSNSKEFTVSKDHLISLAKYSNFFDNCISYSFNDLDQNFVKKYSNIFKSSRGGGFWIWKLNIIEKTLKDMNENDILIYCDAGSSLNYHAHRRFNEYIDILNANDDTSNLRIECEKHHIENEWTSKELFNFFQISPNSKIGLSTQLEAGHILFKKNNQTDEIIKLFHKVLDYDEELITDYYNGTNQISRFRECRHDQSIWSLLTKIYGGIILENETDFRGREIEQYDYPFLAVRRKGHGLRDRMKYKLLKRYYKSKPSYFRN